MTRWVVVGAGSAGCVVAGRLAAAGHDVTIVEAGPATAPADAASFFDATPGLGGAGAVNGMIATPGEPEQYAAWGWDDAPAAFARVRVPLEQPGEDELGPLDRALLAAAPDAELALLTRRHRRRVTSAEAYLADLSVEIIGEATVVRLDPDGVALADGRVVEAERIALAAGAIGSAAILRASGVSHPALGRLRNHAGLPVTLQLRRHVDSSTLVSGTLLRRDDLQVLPLNHLGPAAPGSGMLLVASMTPGDAGALATGDEERLAEGLALVRELLAHPVFGELVERVDVGVAPAGVHHFTSTCAMGAVVDDDGLVSGTDNVHVVDASVFPDVPSTNTYLPTLMLAERLAARLTRQPGARPSTPASAR